VGDFGEGLRGEKADCLSDGWLEEAAVRGVGASVGWQNLSDTEEGRKESGGLWFSMGNATDRWASHLFRKQMS
jgi:hypothetical protein